MASYHIIGGDTKEYGPITAEDIRLWIAEGRLNAQSLAKSSTDTAWRTLASFPEFADVFNPPPPTISPLGAAPQFESVNWEAEVLARQPELRLGECLAAGWSFLGANAGFLAGAVFLAWLGNFIFVLGSLYVPLLGPLACLCFYGVIMGGFYLACLRRMRGEAVAPTEVFSGFKVAFLQLLLAGLVSTLLTEIGVCFCLLPAIYLGVAWAFTLPLVADKKMFFWSAMELSRKVVTKVWFEAFALIIIAFLPVVIFQVFNLAQTGSFFMGLYDEAGQNWQQLAKILPQHNAEIRALTLKLTLVGQAVLLVNFFYFTGVLIRAYENLFGARKP